MEIKNTYPGHGGYQKELISRGYGREDMRQLQFRFVYTAEEAEQNRQDAEHYDLQSDAWLERCAEFALRRNAHMEPIIEAIAKAVVCYQYEDKSMEGYRADWELFFWCNDLYVTTGKLSGRDYSYFTLNFNERHDPERREQIYRKVLEALKPWDEDRHLVITIQWDAVLDEARIRQDAQSMAKKLVGRRCRFNPTLQGIFKFPDDVAMVEGRVVEHQGNYYFMKKRARSRGWKLDEQEILSLGWQLELV